MTEQEQLSDNLRSSINSSSATLEEKVRALAQVTIDFGAALEGLTEPITLQLAKEIEQSYYESPTVGKALILQGVIMMSSWEK